MSLTVTVVKEIGDETGAARGPHLFGVHGGHDRGHHMAGGAVAVQFPAVFVVIV